MVDPDRPEDGCGRRSLPAGPVSTRMRMIAASRRDSKPWPTQVRSGPVISASVKNDFTTSGNAGFSILTMGLGDFRSSSASTHRK